MDSYRLLKALCRRDSIYRYGMILPNRFIEPSKSVKHLELSEGHLYLVRGDSKERAIKIVKLRSEFQYHSLIEKTLKHLSQSIYLDYYILRYDEGVKTLSLQLSKRYVDSVLRDINQICHSKYTWGPLEMDIRTRFKKVNDLVRTINEHARLAFVYPEQMRAWNKFIRGNMLESLTSIHGIKKQKALEIVEKYLILVRKYRTLNTKRGLISKSIQT